MTATLPMSRTDATHAVRTGSVVRAELGRLLRRRTLLRAGLAAAVFAIIAGLSVFSAASDTPGSRDDVSLASLGSAGGATRAFAIGAGFAGFLVFVSVIAVLSAEFTGGTFRALVLREPRRLRVLVGKLAAMVVVLAGFLLVAELLVVVVSLVVAPSADVGTGDWFTAAGLGHAAADFGTVLAGLTGWAVFGATLAVAFRSAPVALGVGFAWAGPFENIVSDSWSTAFEVFPGLVLRSVINGGTSDLGMTRAVITGLVYVGLAAAVCLTLVRRRDVTG